MDQFTNGTQQVINNQNIAAQKLNVHGELIDSMADKIAKAGKMAEQAN